MTSIVSSRGALLASKAPVFLDVLADLWDPKSNPDGIVNLGLAENSLMHSELTEYVNSQPRADPHAFTYGDGFSGSTRLKQSLCQFLNRYFSPHKTLLPCHVSITSGVSNAIECCAWALCEPGEHVLVGCPYFTTFRSLFGNRAGVNILDVKFETIDPLGIEAVGQYEKAYLQAIGEGKVVRAILLCSPHNPLGRCYSEDVLKTYMKLCNKFGLHLICDEIYGLSVWNNPEVQDVTQFRSVLSIDTEGLVDPRMVHVLWGMSKDFGATGLRIGCLISQSNKDVLDSAAGISLFNFPSSLADNVASSLFTDDDMVDNYISLNRSRLAESYLYVTTFLRAHDIPFRPSNAALFVWMNLGATVSDRNITDEEIYARLREQRVYVTSGSTYASEAPGWFRLVIAHPKQVLDEGLKRMLLALKKGDSVL